MHVFLLDDSDQILWVKIFNSKETNLIKFRCYGKNKEGQLGIGSFQASVEEFCKMGEGKICKTKLYKS